MESVLGAAGPPGPGAPGDLGSAALPVSPRRAWWEIVALICLVGAAYGQTLGFDFVWDDPTLVLFNPALRGLIGWRDVFTSPASASLPLMQGADRVYRPLQLSPLTLRSCPRSFSWRPRWSGLAGWLRRQASGGRWHQPSLGEGNVVRPWRP